MNGEPEMKSREMKKKTNKQTKSRAKKMIKWKKENQQLESTIRIKGKRKIIKICLIPDEAESRA